MRWSIPRMFAVVCVAILFGPLGCGKDHQPEAGAHMNVKQAISEVTGTYTWRDDLKRYQYSAKPRLEEILSAQNRDAVVPVLVECLDDISLSRSTIDGRQVAVGIVCHEALTQLVYYEPTAPGGDIATKWPGNISPKASAEQMREAKKAWKMVVEAKLFIFL